MLRYIVINGKEAKGEIMIKNRTNKNGIFLIVAPIFTVFFISTVILLVYCFSYKRPQYKIIWSIPYDRCVKVMYPVRSHKIIMHRWR